MHSQRCSISKTTPIWHLLPPGGRKRHAVATFSTVRFSLASSRFAASTGDRDASETEYDCDVISSLGIRMCLKERSTRNIIISVPELYLTGSCICASLGSAFVRRFNEKLPCRNAAAPFFFIAFLFLRSSKRILFWPVEGGCALGDPSFAVGLANLGISGTAIGKRVSFFRGVSRTDVVLVDACILAAG